MARFDKNKAGNQPRAYLKEWRTVAGLSQTELAKRIGVTKSGISRLESSNRKVTLNWLEQYSKALGVSREQLMSPPGVTIMRREDVVPIDYRDENEQGALAPAPAAPAAPAHGVGEFGLSAAHPYVFASMPSGELLLIDSSKGQVVGRFTKV